jgi:pyridoxal phosphate enzyme (YggS family)
VDLKSRVDHIKHRISQAAVRAGTDLESVRIIAVTKGIDESRILDVVEYGLNDLGENRVQEFCSKYNSLGESAKWHLLGSLQTNKVKYVIDKVHIIHSLDRISLANELDLRARKSDKYVQTLIQVNISEETSKHGLKQDELEPFLEEITKFPRVLVKGLMTIAPVSSDTDQRTTRLCFARLKSLFEKIKSLQYPNVDMCYLSMGMSDDFETAIEEGSNMVRIGRALFGERTFAYKNG